MNYLKKRILMVSQKRLKTKLTKCGNLDLKFYVSEYTFVSNILLNKMKGHMGLFFRKFTHNKNK
ncbi:hypothetical protein AC623_03980 [Bacillus sp. FJAT-27231]|nr:hypothetical protein AC623_03980 [Bacillus sp. FJAT-27231]